jgi:hypothetical protein
MSEIMLPRPDNVRGRFGSYVTNDLFHIAERLQEIDGGKDRLYIQSFDEPIEWHGRTYNFAIVEWVPEKQREELVMRVECVDGRVIQAVERMRAIPFEQRFAEAEKLEAKWAEEDKQRELDQLYERMGGEMLIQLDRCGFVQRPVSFAKRNATARRHRNFKGLGGVMPVKRELILPVGVAA